MSIDESAEERRPRGRLSHFCCRSRLSAASEPLRPYEQGEDVLRVRQGFERPVERACAVGDSRGSNLFLSAGHHLRAEESISRAVRNDDERVVADRVPLVVQRKDPAVSRRVVGASTDGSWPAGWRSSPRSSRRLRHRSRSRSSPQSRGGRRKKANSEPFAEQFVPSPPAIPFHRSRSRGVVTQLMRRRTSSNFLLR